MWAYNKEITLSIKCMSSRNRMLLIITGTVPVIYNYWYPQNDPLASLQTYFCKNKNYQFVLYFAVQNKLVK